VSTSDTPASGRTEQIEADDSLAWLLFAPVPAAQEGRRHSARHTALRLFAIVVAVAVLIAMIALMAG
jgi:hypothetical protein